MGCEFVAAARKLSHLGFLTSDAWAALRDMHQMADTVLLPDVETWTEAKALQEQEFLSFWDALFVAACLHGGVATLYSEDFGQRTAIRGLSLINPFGRT